MCGALVVRWEWNNNAQVIIRIKIQLIQSFAWKKRRTDERTEELLLCETNTSSLSCLTESARSLLKAEESHPFSKKKHKKKTKKPRIGSFSSLSLCWFVLKRNFEKLFFISCKTSQFFFSKTMLLLYYLREKEPLLCDDAFKEQQQHATTTKEFVLFSSNRNKIKIKEKRCFFCFLSLLSWRNVPPFLKLSKRTDTLARDKRRQSSSGAMTTRGQQRRRGDERDSLWDLVAKCDDICFKNTFFRDWMGRMWNSCTEWRVRRESWLRDHLARVI